MDEQVKQTPKGRFEVDKKQLEKHRKIVTKDWNIIKHKTRLKLIIGSNAVSDYFNYGLVNAKNNEKIKAYFDGKKYELE